MKKTILLISVILYYGFTNAQTLLFDNGPLVNNPGAGFGGADVSNLHDGINLYGFNHSVVGGSKMAEDFTVPVAGWTVDSMIFFAYQTNSTLVSSITDVRIGIWDGSPALNSNIIYGDTAVNVLTNSYWSGIYRTTETALTNTARPIMRDVVATPGLALAAGTYFVSWQTGGSASFSGPWAPPVTLGTGIITTGDGLQYTAATGMWNPAKDTAVNAGVGSGTGAIQGLPFLVYGHLTTVGIDEMNSNGFGFTKVYPVPANDQVSIIYNAKENGTVLFSLKDNLGRELNTLERKVVNGENTVAMDVSKLRAGLYFISAKGNSSYNVTKIIKE